MRRPEEILEDALRLSEEQRSKLALELLDSISAPDPRDEAAWIAEVERRARRALSGGSEQDRPLDEAVAHIERELDL
jgi:hypothetical protein